MLFLRSVSLGFKNYANFRGYASRGDFWPWMLFFALTAFAAAALQTQFPANGAGGDTHIGILTLHLGSIAWIELVQRLALLLPTLAFTARRLRDAGYGWGHAFWLLLPLAALILLIILAVKGTDPYRR